MHMLSFRVPERDCIEGVGIDTFSRASQALVKQHPGATLKDLFGLGKVALLGWPKSAGPGRIRILPDGQPEQVVEVKPGRNAHAQWLPPHATVRLEPAQGQGVALRVSGNGTWIQAPGADAQPAFPQPADPLHAAAQAWLLDGHVGASSQCLCAATTGYPIAADADADTSTPRDLDDFGRCLGFLDAVPAARANLSQVAAVSPAWARIVDRFDRLESLARAPATSEGRQDFQDLLDEALGCPPRRPARP